MCENSRHPFARLPGFEEIHPPVFSGNDPVNLADSAGSSHRFFEALKPTP
jgi:hypothetical protein